MSGIKLKQGTTRTATGCRLDDLMFLGRVMVCAVVGMNERSLHLKERIVRSEEEETHVR